MVNGNEPPGFLFSHQNSSYKTKFSKYGDKIVIQVGWSLHTIFTIFTILQTMFTVAVWTETQSYCKPLTCSGQFVRWPRRIVPSELDRDPGAAEIPVGIWRFCPGPGPCADKLSLQTLLWAGTWKNSGFYQKLAILPYNFLVVVFEDSGKFSA